VEVYSYLQEAQLWEILDPSLSTPEQLEVVVEG
jgi:hypothetical protein